MRTPSARDVLARDVSAIDAKRSAGASRDREGRRRIDEQTANIPVAVQGQS